MPEHARDSQATNSLRTYLDRVWGEALRRDPTLRLVGWELATKHCGIAASIEQLARWLERYNESTCVYVHAGLIRGRPSGDRPAVADIVCLPGLWADLDYADACHRTAGLPPDARFLFAFLERLPLRPSVVVHTGHGLLAWWL